MIITKESDTQIRVVEETQVVEEAVYSIRDLKGFKFNLERQLEMLETAYAGKKIMEAELAKLNTYLAEAEKLEVIEPSPLTK